MSVPTAEPPRVPEPGSTSARVCALGVLGAALGLALWLWDANLLVPQAGMQSILAANSLVEGRGLEISAGTPFSKYPPIYPVLLALGRAAGLAVVPTVYLVNVATLAVTLLALHALARALRVRHAWLVPVIYAALGSTHYLLRASRGDAIAIGAFLVAALALVNYAQAGRRGSLLLAAAACAVGALARYMGLFTLLPLGAAATWWFGRRLGLRAAAGARPVSAWKDALVFALVSFIPPGLWLLRNQLVKGHAFGIPKVMGTRAGAEGTDFASNVFGLGQTAWLDLFAFDALGVIRVVYGDTPVPHPGWAETGSVVALVCVVGLIVLRRTGRAPEDGGHDEESVRARERVADTRLVLTVFVALYSAALIAIWTVGQNDPIHTRYVAPLYGPMLLLVASLASRAVAARGSLARVVVCVLAATVLVPNLPKTRKLLGEWPDDRLLEITSRRGANRWHHDLTWDLGTDPTPDE